MKIERKGRGNYYVRGHTETKCGVHKGLGKAVLNDFRLVGWLDAYGKLCRQTKDLQRVSAQKPLENREFQP
jgi:hypothetical protein